MEHEGGLKQYGPSKEHRPNPIVQKGLFMDKSGIPLAFCINSGNQNEQLSLKPLEQQIMRDFELSKFIVCTDAGLSSADKRSQNDAKKFIQKTPFTSDGEIASKARYELEFCFFKE